MVLDYIKHTINGVIRVPVMIIAQTLLYMLGWKFLSSQQIKTLTSKTKTIYVYPHTSNWDFIIGLLYSFAQPEAFTTSWGVMKPQPFRYFGKFLRGRGFIPATRREDNGQGFVAATTKQFKDKSVFNIFISPEGTRVSNPWRSGYYHLAQEMNADICVAGLDYENQCFVIKTRRNPFAYKLEEQLTGMDSRRKLEGMLKEDMKTIVPLYPSSSFICVKAYKTTSWINRHQFLVTISYILLYMAFLYYTFKFLVLNLFFL